MGPFFMSTTFPPPFVVPNIHILNRNTFRSSCNIIIYEWDLSLCALLSLLLLFLIFTFSVANTMVYPPNWATLKSPAAGQKLLGGWPKIGLLCIYLSSRGNSFIFRFDSFLLSIQRVFWVFSNWVILIISLLKSTQIWESGHMIT